MVSSTLRQHFTPGKDPVPIVQGAVWAPRPVWTGGKSRLLWDSIPDRPARSQSLQRLSYPAQIYEYICDLPGESLMTCFVRFVTQTAIISLGSVKQSAAVPSAVWRLATGWKVRGSNPIGGKIFRTRPEWPWSPPILPHNGYSFFPGGKAAGAWR